MFPLVKVGDRLSRRLTIKLLSRQQKHSGWLLGMDYTNSSPVDGKTLPIPRAVFPKMNAYTGAPIKGTQRNTKTRPREGTILSGIGVMRCIFIMTPKTTV